MNLPACTSDCQGEENVRLKFRGKHSKFCAGNGAGKRPLHGALSLHELLSAACRAISSYLKSRDNYVVVTIPAQLFLQRLEKLAFELCDFPTAQARHVNVVARESSLIVVTFALNMHQIELVNKAVTFQESQGSIHGAAID